jgi:SAM-dependent methyltransferase
MIGRLRRRGFRGARRARLSPLNWSRMQAGPPDHFDLVAAMTFSLLASLGLRERHHLLDIGCGPLRIGRLLIPYLRRGHYTGIEPNAESLRAGMKIHVGREQLRRKRPRLIVSADPSALPQTPPFDFALAQSVFSHTGPDLLAGWLAGVSEVLGERGVLVATYVPGADAAPPGWTPEFVTYTEGTLRRMATEAGLRFRPIDWRHPGQRWAIFPKPGFDDSWIPNGGPSWNAFAERELGPPSYARAGELLRDALEGR